jgi:hypothetical protein
MNNFSLNSRARVWVGVCCACLLSCEMFSPREVQKPQGPFVDRLVLSAIMKATGQSFSKTSYEDILHPLFVFIAFNGPAFNHDNEVARLQSIIVDPTVYAIWDTCAGNIQELPDTMIVCRKFKVTYNKTTTDSSVDSGSVQLRLEYYAPKNTWTIRTWQEEGKMSIFNPDSKIQ